MVCAPPAPSDCILCAPRCSLARPQDVVAAVKQVLPAAVALSDAQREALVRAVPEAAPGNMVRAVCSGSACLLHVCVLDTHGGPAKRAPALAECVRVGVRLHVPGVCVGACIVSAVP